VNTVKSLNSLSMAMERRWLNRDDRSLRKPPTNMRKRGMHLRRFANFWIAFLVAVGLFSAPLSAPVFLKTDPAVAADVMAIAGDMPCCPDQSGGKDCASCPFVALCMLGAYIQGPSQAGSLIRRYPVRSRSEAADDQLIGGLDAKPPDHPPRTNV
jgi:hypothetical protein